MRIAVTGASGFVGRYLLERLEADKSIEIVAITRGAAPENSSSIEWVSTDYSVESLRKIIRGCDAVIHLAGVKGAKGTIDFFNTNEVITENLLLAMGGEKVPHIVFSSSRLVYSGVEDIPWKESLILAPINLYGVSKAACEHLCRMYGNQFGFRYSAVRVAQVLGLGEGTRTMINVFIDNSSNHRQLKVIGRSSAKRQYIYVKDLAEILYRLATDDSPESIVVNAGMPQAYTNLEIAQLMNKVFENPNPVDYDDSTEETITSSETDINLLINKTGFTPRDMEEALIDLKSDLLK